MKNRLKIHAVWGFAVVALLLAQLGCSSKTTGNAATAQPSPSPSATTDLTSASPTPNATSSAASNPGAVASNAAANPGAAPATSAGAGTAPAEDVGLEDRPRGAERIVVEDLPDEPRDVDVRGTGARAGRVEAKQAAAGLGQRRVRR